MSDWQDCCYLLHKKPFKDSYSWVWLLTKSNGVVSACIRESRRHKRGTEPFITFASYWCFGREQQILRLSKFEMLKNAYNLVGVAAVSGLYINELIYQTCQKTELSKLYLAYDNLLSQLILGGDYLLISLREFELLLLEDLGYAFSFKSALATKYHYFHYSQDMGLVGTAASTVSSFSRLHLQAIFERDWSVPGALSAAKKLNKLAIQHLLNGKSLQCYNWFQEA